MGNKQSGDRSCELEGTKYELSTPTYHPEFSSVSNIGYGELYVKSVTDLEGVKNSLFEIMKGIEGTTKIQFKDKAETETMFSKRDVSIAFTAVTKASKSSLINFILERKEFCPTARLRCTMKIIEISYGEKEYIEIDGDPMSYPISRLHELVTKRPEDDEKFCDSLKRIVHVYINEEMLRKYNLKLVDVPGFYGLRKMNSIVLQYLKENIDLVYYLSAIDTDIDNHKEGHISDLLNMGIPTKFVATKLDNWLKPNMEIGELEEDLNEYYAKIFAACCNKMAIEEDRNLSSCFYLISTNPGKFQSNLSGV
eukprot:TRINITY_DN13482_c0_g2_i2.p1 TRINITY_DN13482_c0_g2~~TRINITY_DN13482_c0_g2_i2.p1  ORF type:complete len:309 (-),score=62.46 TRINITY_DN13482_c0_g2_i2:15-941(-)